MTEMTKTTIGERMTKIETTLDYIKEASDDNKEEHKEIIKLFTDALKKKADRTEVEELKADIKANKLATRTWVQWMPHVILVILAIINLIIRGG